MPDEESGKASHVWLPQVLCTLVAALVFPFVLFGQDTSKSPGIDWESIPESTLPDKIKSAVEDLMEGSRDRSCLLTPFQRTGSPVWPIQVHVQDRARTELQSMEVKLADENAWLTWIREQMKNPGAPLPPIKYGKKMTRKAGEVSGAETMVLGNCLIHKGGARIILELRDCDTGKSVNKITFNLDRNDAGYLANTPPLNRAVVDWIADRLGQSVGKGGCGHLVEEAFKALGVKPQAGRNPYWGTPVPLTSPIFPGDIVQYEEHARYPNRDDYFAEHHTAVILSVAGNTVTVLHQNYGNEAKPPVTTTVYRNFFRLEKGKMYLSRPEPQDE
jgi:hypothetical protein